MAGVGGYVATTVGIPLLLVLGRPFAPRFATLAVPFLAVLLGLASRAVPGRWLLVLGGGYVTFAAVALFPYYQGFTRSDYGAAMGQLRSEVRPADVVILNGPWQDLLYRRYGDELPPAQIIASTVPLDPGEVIPRLQALAGAHPRLWVVDSATDEADPTGAVAGWLDVHAYPRPVLEFRKAVLRPYLTDSQPASSEARGADTIALGARLRTVELEEWAPRAGAEVRLRVTGDDLEPIGGRRLVARLVGANGVEVWHWDGPLARVDGRLSYRAAMVVPRNAEPGMYALQLVVYEGEDLGSGRRRVTRIADPVEVGQVRVTPR